jgi:hypothetical protein
VLREDRRQVAPLPRALADDLHLVAAALGREPAHQPLEDRQPLRERPTGYLAQVLPPGPVRLRHVRQPTNRVLPSAA